jgi:hypothetical protein
MKLADPAMDAATPEAAIDFRNVRRFMSLLLVWG